MPSANNVASCDYRPHVDRCARRNVVWSHNGVGNWYKNTCGLMRTNAPVPGGLLAMRAAEMQPEDFLLS
jgi:hypothetical protein